MQIADAESNICNLQETKANVEADIYATHRQLNDTNHEATVLKSDLQAAKSELERLDNEKRAD